MFIEQSSQKLKDNNQKLTKTRLWILSQLENITKPINPYELLNYSKDSTIDVTTIYRNLELFEGLGIVHKIHSMGGYMPCTHNHLDCHHAHDIIICHHCNTMSETHIDTNTKNHLGLGAGPVELRGCCHSCEQKK